MKTQLTNFEETEIGLIPEEWGVLSIDSVANVVGGGTPSTSRADYFGGSIPWITPRDLSSFQGRFIERGERNISEEGLNSSGARILPKGSVLLSSRAPVGYLAIAADEVTTNQGFQSLVPSNKVDNLFLYYLLRNNTQKLIDHSSGSTFQELSGKTLRSLTFAFPDTQEQYRIASILSSLDDKIELNRQINANLEKMASALFKRWFVDFEFPDEKGRPYKTSGGKMVETEMGEVPEGWRVSQIGDEVKVVGGGTPSTTKSEYWDGDIHWATPKDLSNLVDPIILNTESRITEDGLGRISSGLLPTGTVLLSSRAPIGYLAITEVPIAINQGFIAMRCEDILSKYYVRLWVKRNMEIIKGYANGSTFLEVNKANFRTLPVVVPIQQMLHHFDLQMEAIHQRILSSLKESQALISIRDSLLPRLMSGKIRT